MEALPMGQSGPDSVLRLGLTGDSVATVNHGDELGEAVIRLAVGNRNRRPKLWQTRRCV